MNIQIDMGDRYQEGVHLVGIMEESMFENVGIALYIVQSECVLSVNKITRTGINCYDLNDELETFQFDSIGETIEFAKRFTNLSAAELLLIRNQYPRKKEVIK